MIVINPYTVYIIFSTVIFIIFLIAIASMIRDIYVDYIESEYSVEIQPIEFDAFKTGAEKQKEKEILLDMLYN